MWIEYNPNPFGLRVGDCVIRASEGGSYEGGYSQAKDDMMMMLGEMMEDASTKEREALKKCMRELERD